MDKKRSMRTAAKLVPLIIVLCASSFASGAQPRDTTVIDKFISSQESQKNGYQAEGIRTVLRGDLNHDGIPDTAVLYTLEGQDGSNNYVQYLAVFVRLNGRLVHAAHTPVGGKNWRAIEIKSIRNNVIFCNTTSYAENDPSCCPTIKGSTRYTLVGDNLKEVPQQ
jgi:hypothetical protein